MPSNDGLSTASSLVEAIKKSMTATEARAWRVLDRKTSRMWRNFWIECAHRRGYSNMDIAREFEISESNVRVILSK